MERSLRPLGSRGDLKHPHALHVNATALPLTHAPTILPWLVPVVNYAYAVGSDCYCQIYGEIEGTKLKAVYSAVDECAFISIESFPNRNDKKYLFPLCSF